eukprot:TRINITY_DN1647_c0_g2_i1.p1 TRINITY_DN1647_c0_g2~~TRINITY_DN1647_c0_g2_i1.p1  ORF type:complete len:236 (-),score=46.74 TRINITY_DN1647_c0_g2_i1:160-867(-)
MVYLKLYLGKEGLCKHCVNSKENLVDILQKTGLSKTMMHVTYKFKDGMHSESLIHGEDIDFDLSPKVVATPADGRAPEILVRHGMKCLENSVSAVAIGDYSSTLSYLSSKGRIPRGLIRRFGEDSEMCLRGDSLTPGSKKWDRIEGALVGTVKALKKPGNLYAHPKVSEEEIERIAEFSPAFVQPQFSKRATAVFKLLKYCKEKTGFNPIESRDHEAWLGVQELFEDKDADTVFS